ncbi:MAG: putative RNA-binding protein rbpD [Bacteroidota bacterium]
MYKLIILVLSRNKIYILPMNIFVSNISFKVREQSLKDLFSQYGEVSNVRIIRDKESRRSKGYGFIEMPDDKQGETAIEALNGFEHFERKLVVAEAKGKRDESAPATDAD